MAADSSVDYSQEGPINDTFHDGDPMNPQFGTLSCPKVEKASAAIDAQSNCRSQIKQKMNNAENHATRIDIDIEKGKLEGPKAEFCDEISGKLKMDDSLARMLHREITSMLGGKLMQLLMNNSFELPKLFSRDKSMNERCYDMATNRLRKYKRSASFSSRRVVLLFSILSSMGTLVLIYLTLRVRQIAESGNI
ncbi:unnamed protein product [Cuscuta epithymum]|uniref:Uncharacterized protein n=1 Tax=Cuscuta epithymum TaxID=186058 RepID=A0AAV0FII6_9ASTE|nr:unnamed protein product [Cuscuta epithymum]CAH9135117.1 unnamed protein product [Cuscuta epithymum]